MPKRKPRNLKFEQSLRGKDVFKKFLNEKNVGNIVDILKSRKGTIKTFGTVAPPMKYPVRKSRKKRK